MRHFSEIVGIPCGKLGPNLDDQDQFRSGSFDESWPQTVLAAVAKKQ